MSACRLGKGKQLLILGIALVVIDQVIKILVKTNMTMGSDGEIRVFEWFRILFIENKGMAFGMAFGGVLGKILLTLFRVGLSGLLIWWIAKLLKRERPVPPGVLVGLTLIAAGAVGNLIDCLFYGMIFSESTASTVAAFGGSYAPFMQGRVVDMFYFPLWEWPDWLPLLGGHKFFEPVFNFADSCVTVGALYLIFFQWRFFAKEEDKKKEASSDR
ncbi:MAG: lipoprotein signal peptidase [Bacteroidota bacterium]|nr:lipoprotein signal peptidase [Bacteroidota bacterium]